MYEKANMDVWCLGVLSTLGTTRLTVDILGFVTGIVIQKLFQNLFIEREKDFDVNYKLSPSVFLLSQ